MRKMVNSMSAKMEIGSPMASMYLLGNPDHYASHTYVPFAWRSYLDGKFIPTSGVDDYRYRPIVYNHVTLYEWIQCSEKKKRTFSEREDILSEDDTLEDDNEPEDDLDEDDLYLGTNGGSALAPDDDVSDWETDDEDDIIIEKQARIDKARKPVRHSFAPGHSLFLSHSVSCHFENLNRVIPNFIGGTLPRADKGDRAAYCMAMLTLFKPWRAPEDLKDDLSTWNQAFEEHIFTERQAQLINNFNVRFECNDARDDHFAQMKKKLAEAKASGESLFPAGFMDYKDKFAEDLNDFDYGSDDDNLPGEDDENEMGPKTRRLLSDVKEMRNIMQTSGWLDACNGGLPGIDTDF
ncbi:hypothetical protein C8R44DRAFT_562701, partial [Mycena epipterygia]